MEILFDDTNIEKTFGHPKLVPTFPWISLIVTERDFLEHENEKYKMSLKDAVGCSRPFL